MKIGSALLHRATIINASCLATVNNRHWTGSDRRVGIRPNYFWCIQQADEWSPVRVRRETLHIITQAAYRSGLSLITMRDK